jgi:DNA invertase Pin-like site-specific DNA recombinase
MAELTQGRTGGVKTFAIRVPDELHAQFALVSMLEGLSLNDTGVLAIQELVDRKRADGDFNARATAALAEIEREAEARRTAIQALLSDPAGGDESPKRGRSPRTSD